MLKLSIFDSLVFFIIGKNKPKLYKTIIKSEIIIIALMALIFIYNYFSLWMPGGKQIFLKHLNYEIPLPDLLKKSEGSIHKVAATILGAESCNGWTYWHYNKNGAILPIDDLRQRLISNN